MVDGSFARGTTPTHIFPIPPMIRMSDLADFTITYRQKNKNILVKTKEDTCRLYEVDASRNITIILTQEDTFLFDPRIKIVEVQIKALSTGGDVFILGNYRLRLEEGFETKGFEIEDSQLPRT